MDFEGAFDEELGEILASRGEPDADEARRRELARDLVGLCFSGGGIRSSTFNLGIVRGLYRWGVLQTVDYLSTVSGGGYIGSHVADVYRLGEQAKLLAPGNPEGVERLRKRGRFLTPTGSLGEWLQGFGGLGAGVLWNAAVFVILALVLAATFSFFLTPAGAWRFDFPHGYASASVVGLAVLGIMLSALGERTPPAGLFVGLLVATALVAMMDGLPALLDYFLTRDEGLTVAAIGSGAAALVGRVGLGGDTKLPPAVYLTLARAVAFLLAVFLPLCLFLLLLCKLLPAPPTTVLIGQLACFGLLVVFLVVDFNRVSLHPFYRDRIGATFLATERGADEQPKPPPKLSAFAGKPGPLHLINVALNVPADDDLHLRDRLADFFTLSRLHAGSERTGYVPIAKLQAAHPEFTAASAVAISGAAASPNMGSYTDSLLRPLMTALNIRMGYWLANPKRLREATRKPWRWVPRLPTLFLEMAGSLTSKGRLVNISDGGHLENLGAMELLRRRCTFIIIGDGGADPEASLGELAILIRFAARDLGATIEIDVDDLRRDERGFSTKQAALGIVIYADGSVGRLLYLKSTVTGLEAPDVRYYQIAHPDFPSESTADQWFDDAQFDAYLRLGEDVVDSLFHQLGYVDPSEAAITKASLPERLAALGVVLAPCSRSQSTELMSQLRAVQTELMRPEFAAYRLELTPTIHRDPAGIPDRELNRYTPLVMMQLQLMHGAVLELGLIDAEKRQALANRGWMNLFQRWAQSSAFRRLTLVCLPSFGASLSHFVDVALHLGTTYTWGPLEGEDGILGLVEATPEQHGMLVGLAHYEGALDAGPRVKRLVMRGGLGGRDRVELAIAALRETHPRVEFVGAAKKIVERLTPDAYANRAHEREWTADDEALLLAFTRRYAEPESKAQSPKPSPTLQARTQAQATTTPEPPRVDERPEDDEFGPPPSPFGAINVMSFGVTSQRSPTHDDDDDDDRS
ncbi:hypothetical protein PPSIR1_00385 [Plesiocystis pacifica SIR-1]|uniref:PNPLA domain-containing protein n=1 Tax=Plesiocystis pacifica SIR-1 TaxID=391625 RepID=A6GGC3_9BACT|nr:hypothetical protein [Plesiocystis pacifica]EDM75097.1 hypothetical protein PPSIR1_00385 [Plesiocystis pacifica SIR-1]